MPDLELKGLSELLEYLPANVITVSAVRAVNRTLTTVRQQISIRVRETYNLKASDVKDAIVIKATTVKSAKDGEVLGEIHILGKRVPLIQFAAKPKVVESAKGKRMGVTVDVKGNRKLVQGGFIVTMKSGKTGIFKRTPEAASSSGNKRNRLPIEELFSVGVGQIVQQKDFLDGIQTLAQERFQIEFEREVNFQIGKEAERLAR